MPKKIDYSHAKELYDQGLNDGQIARILKCNSQTVYTWRKKNNLKAHFAFGGTTKENTGKFGYEMSESFDPDSIANKPYCINYFIKGKKHGQP